MATPIPSYNRVPPPNDPDSHPLHLDGELGKLERTTSSLITTVSAIPGIYAPLISPTFSGVPTVPTAAPGTNTTQAASTAFVTAAVGAITVPVTSVAGRTGAVVLAVADVTGAAPLASPALTGSPTAPTATTADNSTLLATTAFVKNQAYATLASPALTGSPTAPTASQGDNSTKLATTAYVDRVAVWTTVPKTTSTTITSNTTFADDPELKFAMASSSTYAFRFYLSWNNVQQGKFAVNGPTGLVSLRAVTQTINTTSAYDTIMGVPVAGLTFYEAYGFVQNGTTAGTFALRIAQNASSGSATVLEKGSWLEWTKLA